MTGRKKGQQADWLRDYGKRGEGREYVRFAEMG